MEDRSRNSSSNGRSGGSHSLQHKQRITQKPSRGAKVINGTVKFDIPRNQDISIRESLITIGRDKIGLPGSLKKSKDFFDATFNSLFGATSSFNGSIYGDYALRLIEFYKSAKDGIIKFQKVEKFNFRDFTVTVDHLKNRQSPDKSVGFLLIGYADRRDNQRILDMRRQLREYINLQYGKDDTRCTENEKWDKWGNKISRYLMDENGLKMMREDPRLKDFQFRYISDPEIFNLTLKLGYDLPH